MPCRQSQVDELIRHGIRTGAVQASEDSHGTLYLCTSRKNKGDSLKRSHSQEGRRNSAKTQDQSEFILKGHKDIPLQIYRERTFQKHM